MTRDEFIQQAYLWAVGKATPPTEGTNKHSVLLGTGNGFIEAWQNEQNTDWKSLYQRTVLTPLVTATDTFAIDPLVVRKISTNKEDTVIVTATSGKTAEYAIVTPEQLNTYEHVCARVGNNLVFSEAFESGSEFIGGTITMPNFGFATKLTTDVSVVPVDQPMWLVYMTAAEFVRNNDYIKQNQYPNLISMANEVMKSMKLNNKATQVMEFKRDWTPLSQSW